MSYFPVADSENFVVHYDPVTREYRVTVFKDGHFWDEFWFEEYKEEEASLVEALENHDYKVFKNTANLEDYTYEQVKAAIDDFNRMVSESAKNDKELYEEAMVKTLTNWDRD
jgi:hypothetical protein